MLTYLHNHLSKCKIHGIRHEIRLGKIEDKALEVIAGKWGTGDELRKNLAAAGLPYIEIMAAVAILKAK